MFSYPARVTPDGHGFLVRFPDIPEAIAGGATREAAIDDARDALETAMEFYFEQSRPVPLPSLPKRGQVLVGLPTSVAAKVLLLNTMLEQGVSASELARRLHTSPQAVNRIVTLGHATKIDTIADAIGVLGRRLTVVLD
jgi:antitoxin HicB